MGIWDRVKSWGEKKSSKIEKSPAKEFSDKLSKRFAYGKGEGPSASRLSAEKRAGIAGEERRSSRPEREVASKEAESKRIAGLSEVTPDTLEGAAEIKTAWEQYQTWSSEAEEKKVANMSTARANFAASGMREDSPAWMSALEKIEADYATDISEIKGGATYQYLQDQYSVATTPGGTYGGQNKYRPAGQELGMEEWYGQAWGGDAGVAQSAFNNFGAQANIYNTPLGA